MPGAQTDTYGSFVVDGARVAELKTLITQLAAHSRYTQLSVPAPEFADWCAALGVESFITFRMKSGTKWVSTGTTHLVDTVINSEFRMLSVTCDEKPADWVDFPRGEGHRRWMFRYTLQDKERETT